MWGDLEQLKRGAAEILSAMLERPDKPIHDYVFVPFNDPAVGPASVTTDPDEFRARLEAVQVRGGLDCPEPSLTALLEALKLVRPNSYVYVFTDASAKDYHLLDHVLALVQRKQTQVVFVMTGNCKDGNTMRYQSMESVAAASAGQIFHINKAEVENVLNFVRRTLDSQKVNLGSVDLLQAGKKEHAVQVDETIREFTVSVSGEHPHISVVNPEGIKLDSSPALQSILDLDNVKVVAVKEPTRGSWTVETSSDSKHAVRLTGLSVVDFAYGFSAQVTDRLDETYHRPLLDAPNFIMVGGTDMGSVWNLTSVDLLAIDGSTLQSIPLTPLGALDGLYRGGPFIPPPENKLFYLANVGHGNDGYPIKRITPTAISAQAGGLPTVHLLAEPKVWLNGSLNLRCQIDSLLPFTAWFFKNNIPISKKQKYQQTALMTLKIDGLTEEMGGDYVCRASNVKGFSKDVAHVIVTGPLPEVVTELHVESRPQQQVVLDCFVKSKLRFNVTWIRILPDLHNDVEYVENNARYMVLPNSSLVIDPALPEDSGQFSCVAENIGGRKESRVQLTKKSLGNVMIESTGRKLTLHVTNAKLRDQAVYRCVGNNERESVDADAVASYVEIPSVTIENISEMVMVGEQVFLKCSATGIPKPTKRWLWQGIDVESLPNFKVYEDGSLQINEVQPETSGQLDCVSQNLVGEVKDSVNLTIGLPAKIGKEPSVLELEILGSGMLECSGNGYPEPTIHWERRDGGAMDSSRIHHDATTGSLLFTGEKK
ncbi:hypothetical protein ONE63_003968 [Megalurothrips usitatus]|uniref:Ig-like domain-containing protein n=1 Tax=Megalurothrips usitatus TaxID=439358 RepID=A0AAV7X4P2_9NEOP|nr:hypothetical protein ONE63_003968 [Megalurothrips usitatus]